MEYLFGALGTVAFFIVVYVAYRAGQRTHKPAHREVDEEQQQKAKELRKGFEQLMSYDVSKATGKRVT